MSYLSTRQIASVPPVVVEVPATSANCGPGFDCLGVALSLFNRLELRPAETDSLRASGEGEAALRDQTTSLAHSAARAAWDALELEPTGFAIRMQNQVPFARGLGSSSAAIVGGLVAANEWARAHHGRSLSEAQLLDLATEIEGHPDNVAPALLGDFCVCATREDGKAFALTSPVKRYPRFVVWIPEAELATEKARAALPHAYSRADCVFNLSRAALQVAALATGDFAALAESVRDRVHQDYRAPLVPGWAALSEAAQKHGALGTTLSGAGPTILFWLHPDMNGHDQVMLVSAIQSTAEQQKLAGRVEQVTVGQRARLIDSL